MRTVSTILLVFICKMTLYSQTSEWKENLQGVYTYGTTDPVYLEGDDGKLDSSFAFCSYGELEMYYVQDSIYFSLDVCNATYHTGGISGVLNFESNRKATFLYKENDKDFFCHLEFVFKKDTISITEISCKAWHGHRASFDGEFHFTRHHILSQQREERILTTYVNEFFDHFNSGEYSSILSLTSEECVLNSWYLNKVVGLTSKKASLKELKPMFDSDLSYEEVISNVTTLVNNNFAVSWMDYIFRVEGEVSHCGANRLDWIKTKTGWKIYQITDNVNTSGCQDYNVGEYDPEKPYSEILLDKGVHHTMDTWHKAAAEADEDVFFPLMSEDCIYLGTDASERWTKETFMSFAIPHFQKESAWAFTANWRNIYYTDNYHYAWFEESLDTWMGECRGSGVLEHTNGHWRIKHYNLSVTIDNNKIKSFIELVNTEK